MPADTTPDFGEHVVARYGEPAADRPLVVLLHGRGATEAEILSLAQHLPVGPEYVAVRAPIAEGLGYVWFANRGIGRPVAESLAATMAWFRSWLDRTWDYLVGDSGAATRTELAPGGHALTGETVVRLSEWISEITL